MTVEVAQYVADLNKALPPGNDPKAEGDDHLRLIKTVLQNTFPNANGPIPLASIRTLTEGAATANNFTTITVPTGFVSGMCDVYIGGAALSASDYTESGGNTITLKNGIDLGTQYKVVSFSPSAVPVQNVAMSRTEGTATAGQVDIPTNAPFLAGLTCVYVDGVKLMTTDYVDTSGTKITLNKAMTAGMVFQVEAWAPVTNQQVMAAYVLAGKDMTMIRGNLRIATDLNLEYSAGYCLFNNTTANTPVAGISGHCEILPAVNDQTKPTISGNWTTQIAISNESPSRMWYRMFNGGPQTWTAWTGVVNAGTDGTYARPGIRLSADLNAELSPGPVQFQPSTGNIPVAGSYGICEVLNNVNPGALVNGNWIMQRVTDTSVPPYVYVRNNINNSGWSAWIKLLDNLHNQSINGNQIFNGTVDLYSWISSHTGGTTNSFVATGDKGGAFVDWTAALCPALQMDCPNNGAAYMGLRWTRWGARHLAAIHCYEGGSGTSLPTLSFALDGNNNVHVFHRTGAYYTTMYGFLQDYFQPKASDLRDKRDVGPSIVDALAVIKKINLFEFRWKEGLPQNPETTHECAPVAQNLQEAMASLVETVKNGAGEERLVVNMMDLLGLALKGIQQLEARIATLEGVAP